MPIGWLYGKLADLRNALYDRGLMRSYPLGARTISIGNITAGGTGKTPLVAAVAEMLAARGERVCVLTRGYGRKNVRRRVLVSDRDSILADAESGGDEPVELAGQLLGKAIIVADADRVAAAKWALTNFDITAFILDDGFQHRRAKRDVDIVCIDATNPFGGGKMLPSGRLREPVNNLERADAVVVTRSDIVGDISDLRSEIARFNPKAAVFTAQTQISRIVPLSDFPLQGPGVDRSDFRSSEMNGAARFFAFCALGNPRSFFQQIGDLFESRTMGKSDLAGTKAFADHHFYTDQDVRELERLAGELGADALLTTAKDAVKLKSLAFTLPCFVVEVKVILDRESEFEQML